MRMEKNADNKKTKKKKTRNVDGKNINKQTNKGKKSFFEVAVRHGWTIHLHTERDANSWHSFVPCNSFH